MPTITATPNADGSVDLLLDTGDPSAQFVSLIRTDANGARDVRLPVGTPDTFEALTLVDHECAIVGALEYELTIALGGVEQFATAAATVAELVPPHTWILHPAVIPEDRQELVFSDWQMGRTARSVENAVIGRREPVVNRDVLATREGSLEVLLASYQEVEALIAVCESAETLILRQNDFPGLDGYFEVRRVTPRIHRATARPGNVKWWAQLELIEVAPPRGPLLANVTWTFGASLARSGTFRVSRAEFPTLRDLLLGPDA